MVVFSHSRIESFGNCPLRYKYRYIDRVKTEIERSIEAFMGSMVHEALEKLYKDLRFMYIDTLKELLEYYNKIWEKNWTDNIVIVRKEFGPDNYRKMGEQYIKDYYEKYHPFNQMKTISLEQKITVDLFKDKKYTLQGFIDRLATDGDGTFEIHDYKTSSSLPADDKVNEDRQLALYSIAIKNMYPYAKKVFLVWHYLKFRQEIRIEKTSEQLDDLKKSIAKRIDEINSAREFPAKESILCDWCEFKPICPKKKHLYETERMEPEQFEKDDGVKLITDYAILNSKKKQIEEELKDLEKSIFAFASQQKIENIAGRGVVARLWTGNTFKMPRFDDPQREDFEKIIKDAGLWNGFSRLNSFTLSKSIQAGKIDANIIKKLAPFIEKDIVRRIYLKEKNNE